MSVKQLPPSSEEETPAADIPTTHGSRPMLRGFVIMIVLGVLGLALGSSLSEADESTSAPTAPRELPVDVIAIQSVDSFDVMRTYTGTIAARRTSELGFERSAIVIAMNADEGDHVQAGQSLAQLDTRHLKVQADQIRAQRSEATAVLQELEAGPRLQTIDAARATVEDLKAKVELQDRLFQRSSELVKEYAISQERVDEFELGLRSAKAQLRAAEESLEELEAGTRKERIAAQRAVVAQLDQQLADLQIEIQDSDLLAPFDGRIAMRYVDEGTVTSPAQPVIRLVESGHLEARIGVPAAALASIEVGQSMDVTVNRQNWPATVARIAPELDAATRTRLVIFELAASATDHVVPRQIVRVRIKQRLPTQGYWVPTSSLVRSVRGLWAAYVVESNEAGEQVVRRQDVEVLHTDGQRTLVRGTLIPGDHVIVAGTHRVVPGQRVSIKSARTNRPDQMVTIK